KVLDFGLAKLTQSQSEGDDVSAPPNSGVKSYPGMIIGTIRYMAPEQARGLAVDARADIFSLGVTLYEMVARRAPFDGGTNADVIVSLLTTEPPPLSVSESKAPDELRRIVARALEKDPEKRYQTAADFALDLKRLKHTLNFEDEMERTARHAVAGGDSKRL